MNPDERTLGEAKDWLEARVINGALCPCCGQMAKIYRRKINSGMARLLIAQWLAVGTDWGNTAHISTVSREGAKLAYWDLMEADGGLRDDGGHSGRWRITFAGREFLMGRSTVQKYAHVYNGTVLWKSGPQVSIQQALGTKFNYSELMAGI